MGKLDYKTTIALEKKLMEDLQKKADELEEYKKSVQQKTPTYESAPEDMYEKPVTYDRQVYYPKSQKEIEQIAVDSLKSDYDAGKEKIVNGILSDISGLEKKRKAQEDDKYYALNSLSQKYDELKKQKAAKMIDNGLSRSSIKEESEKDLLKEGDLKKQETQEAFDKKDKSVLDSISDKESEMDEKLKEYQKKYEKALSGKINSLTAEQNKTIAAVTKANEGLTDKELAERAIYESNVQKEYARRKKEQEDAEQEYEKALNNAREQSYYDRYRMAWKVYSTMPSEKAVEMIKANTELHSLLGNTYFERLLRALS